MSIGKNVRKYREEKGLDQTELAQRVCVSQAMIARIENDTKPPSVALLKSIAVTLECTMDDLVA